MLRGSKEWGIPVVSFLVAVLLSIVAGPSSRAFSFRSQAQPTGECCHDLIASPQAHGTATRQRVGLQTGKVFSIGSASTDANGQVILSGLVNSGNLKIGPVVSSAQYELRRRPKKDCKHVAGIANRISAQCRDQVTESGNIIPVHKGTKVVELKSAIATDFFTDLSDNRHAEQAVGRLFEVADNTAQVADIESKQKSKGPPELTFGLPISLGGIKGDDNEQAPIPIVIAGPLKDFNRFATFIIQSSLQLELSIVTKDFTKATGLVSVDVEGPAFGDLDEGVFVRFDERNTYQIKDRCDGPERIVDVPLSEAQNKRLNNLIHQRGPVGEPTQK